MQTFVKILRLIDSPELIKGYVEAHKNIWPEIPQGIRRAGITRMDIYLDGNTAVMIMEMPDGVDPSAAMALLATLPRQAEWEEYVSHFQGCAADETSDRKWKPMEKIFEL